MGKPKKTGLVSRLAAGSVAALFLLTAIPSVVFSVRPRESGSETAVRFSEEEIKMASDISNMTGVKVEEILAMKEKGSTWYEILDALKANGDPDGGPAEDEKSGDAAGSAEVADTGYDGDTGDTEGAADTADAKARDTKDAGGALPAGYDPGRTGQDAGRIEDRTEVGDVSTVKTSSDLPAKPPVPENGLRDVMPENPADRIVNEVKELDPNTGR